MCNASRIQLFGWVLPFAFLFFVFLFIFFLFFFFSLNSRHFFFFLRLFFHRTKRNFIQPFFPFFLSLRLGKSCNRKHTYMHNVRRCVQQREREKDEETERSLFWRASTIMHRRLIETVCACVCLISSSLNTRVFSVLRVSSYIHRYLYARARVRTNGAAVRVA